MAEEDVAGALIAALGAQGEHIDDGRFTLDATKAQAKLREYQLGDPHGYLLLLVEAAWLGTRDRDPGRRARIDIECGVTTTVVFDSPSFTSQALGNLFGVALGDATGLGGDRQATRVLQLIGLAANSALALEPRRLSIEVVAPDGRIHRAEITVDGIEVTTLEQSAPVPEVRFVFEGTRLGNLGAGEITTTRPTAERALVSTRCRLSSFEIRVDGKRVSLGPKVEFDGKGEREVVLLGEDRIGTLGFEPEFGVAKARVINRGVEVEPIRLRGPDGLLAVIEVDLPMDLSRSQLLKDAALEAVMAAIQAAIARLPNQNRPINWRAVRTGDGAMFVVLGLIVAGAVGLAALLVLAVQMLASG